MTYTVREAAKLSGTTIKTLYHYQKMGLLLPQSIGENGYRYYSDRELERLQQILFYRELDFSLEQIKTALENEPNRLKCLEQQRTLLRARQERLTAVLNTLDQTISHAQKGVPMNQDKMFIGLNQEEWKKAFESQNEYLEKEYGYSIDAGSLQAETVNEKAQEAAEFMNFMAASLRNGVRAWDESVKTAIRNHINYLNQDSEIDGNNFAAQTQFFLADDFHRGMLEDQQTGLSYYLCAAAEHYVKMAE